MATVNESIADQPAADLLSRSLRQLSRCDRIGLLPLNMA